jgi:hypothetical protein
MIPEDYWASNQQRSNPDWQIFSGLKGHCVFFAID